MNYLDFFEATIVNNGATFNPIINELNPNKGYFVSFPQYEQRIKVENFTTQHVKDFINIHSERLTANVFVGSWIDNGIVYLDLSEQIVLKRIAITLAYQRNQKAIFDANLGKVLELPSPQTSGTYTQQKAYVTSVINKLCIT